MWEGAGPAQHRASAEIGRCKPQERKYIRPHLENWGNVRFKAASMDGLAAASTPARSPSASTARRISHRRLVDLDLASFPYRQVVRLENGSVDDAARIVRRTLTDLGFDVGGNASGASATTRPGSTQTAESLLILGERNLSRDTMDAATIATLAIVVVSGAVLGVVDAFITRNWIAVPAWLASFGLVAALLWVAFGRSYRSDVVVALVGGDRSRPGPPGPPEGASRPVLVTWLAGRVRSELRAAPSPDTRRAARVQEAYGVVGVLASVVRAFRTQAEGQG